MRDAAGVALMPACGLKRSPSERCARWACAVSSSIARTTGAAIASSSRRRTMRAMPRSRRSSARPRARIRRGRQGPGAVAAQDRAHVIEKRVPPTPEVDFDLLDETLRSDATRTQRGVVADHAGARVSAVGAQAGLHDGGHQLPVAGRARGVRDVVGDVEDRRGSGQGARDQGVAFKVRLSRARKKIGDYLAPRCEHIDPRNPCHCPSRVGIALSKGFIAPPQTSVVQLRTPQRPFDQEIKSRDATKIFQTLPPAEVPAELVQKLRAGGIVRRVEPSHEPPPRESRELSALSFQLSARAVVDRGVRARFGARAVWRRWRVIRWRRCTRSDRVVRGRRHAATTDAASAEAAVGGAALGAGAGLGRRLRRARRFARPISTPSTATGSISAPRASAPAASCSRRAAPSRGTSSTSRFARRERRTPTRRSGGASPRPR